MNIKSKMKKILEIDKVEEIISRVTTKGDELKESSVKLSEIDLNCKVDKFLKWYLECIPELSESDEMRNFIEKMAVWYELRYPDYEINRIIPCSSQELKNINEIMFQENVYIKSIFDENSDISCMDWSKFYNTQAFIKSLPLEESWYLNRPKYPSIVYVGEWGSFAHFHLTASGIIEEAEGMEIAYLNLEGKNIKEAVEIMENDGFIFPKRSEVIREVKRYDNRVHQKEEMLNCVMYRIIERGGNRIGPRRAFLFAKEFGRNIDIPMKYGVDTSDPGLRNFVNCYVKAGGSKDLLCYNDYFSKEEKIDTISIREILKRDKNYTSEEKELHQRLINILASNINQNEVKKEKIKLARIQRKLEKSKTSSTPH